MSDSVLDPPLTHPEPVQTESDIAVIDEPNPAPPAAHMRPSSRSRLWTLGFLVLMVALVVATRMPTMNQPVVEHHAFRQTHTAYVTKEFVDNGIDLIHYKMPVLGIKGEIPLEFPVFEALATIPVNLGLPVDKAMRTTALTFFCISMVLLFALVRRLFGARAAALATIWFGFSPFSYEWSRASLMEFSVIAFALAMTLCMINYRDALATRTQRALVRRSWLAAGIVCGSLAMLIKPTTATFWFIPALIYSASTTVGVRKWLRERLRVGVVAMVVIPFLLTAWWTRLADNIKGADIATFSLRSDQQYFWNYGDIPQRLGAWNWRVIFDRTQSLITIMPVAAFALLGIIAAVRVRRSPMALSMLAICVLPPLVFFNLYVVHDYYQCGVLAQICIVMGLIADRIFAVARSKVGRSTVSIGLVAFMLVALVTANEYYKLPLRKIPNPPNPEALELAAHSSKAEISLVQLNDLSWDPSLAYYADRHVQMLTGPAFENPEWIRQLQNGPYHTYFAMGVTPRTNTFLAPKLWIAPVVDQVMQFGNAGDAVPSDAMAIGASSLPANLQKLPAGTPAAATERSCQGATPYTTLKTNSGSWEWFEIANRPADGWFAVNNGAFPTRQYVAMHVGGDNALTCDVGQSYTITPVGLSATPTW